MASVPSLNMFAYVGGHFNEGKAEKFWLPYQNLAFAVSPGTPEQVWSTLLHHSPLSIPILCGQSGHFRNRTVFNFNGTELTYTDTAMLENFQESARPCFLGNHSVFSLVQTEGISGSQVDQVGRCLSASCSEWPLFSAIPRPLRANLGPGPGLVRAVPSVFRSGGMDLRRGSGEHPATLLVPDIPRQPTSG